MCCVYKLSLRCAGTPWTFKIADQGGATVKVRLDDCIDMNDAFHTWFVV